MNRLFVPLALLFALPMGWAAEPEPQQPTPVKEIELRFQHREARIREALAHGDLTEAEAEYLRHRLERKRNQLKHSALEPNSRPKPPHPAHPKPPNPPLLEDTQPVPPKSD
ncbi:hypothetical protein [Chitinimonas sp. BJB300]|uniref:hypothetical protein n=1 Tax=Chitinimonas sp. BJB300 TaxID=1559339 RepID=UPI000C0E7E3E|nr:hypothetical protein [Chitinimonas sp. BJB300]PHV13048.1 hypothetical protein CSQ89_02425 [Chitinimonas sp. BJB300]TSJ87742.1 hypothetical protein FG002_012430 [Chitinimonas sp. BJB300]